MPMRQNNIRVGATPKSRESSALRSPNDSSDMSKLWRKYADLASQVQSNAYELRRLQEIINRLRIYKPQGGSSTSSSPCPLA